MLEDADLESRITPRTKAILINTPHNPTGRVLGAGRARCRSPAWRRIHDLLVLADETLGVPRLHERAASRASRPGPAWPSAPSPSTGSRRRSRWRAGGSATCTERPFARREHAEGAPAPRDLRERGGPRRRPRPRSAARRGGASRSAPGSALRRELVARALDAVPGIRSPLPDAGLFCFPDITGTGMDDCEFADFCLAEAARRAPPGLGIRGGRRGARPDRVRAALDRLAEARHRTHPHRSRRTVETCGGRRARSVRRPDSAAGVGAGGGMHPPVTPARSTGPDPMREPSSPARTSEGPSPTSAFSSRRPRAARRPGRCSRPTANPGEAVLSGLSDALREEGHDTGLR